MDLWLLVLLSLVTLAAALKFLSISPAYNSRKKRLPPGPPTLPLLGSILWLSRPHFDIEPVLRQLRDKYGPILTLYIGTRPAVFITDRSLAHEALVTKGSLFSDRPPPTVAGSIITDNQHNINSAAYGPLWRLLRRNLMSEILHPSRVKSFAEGRKWVLELLIKRLRSHEEKGEAVRVVESLQRAMFCLLLLMCFGQKLEESTVEEIERVERRLLTCFVRFNIFAFLPRLGRIVFRKRLQWLLEMRTEQERVLTPLIRARRDRQEGCQDEEEEKNSFEFSYVDSLLALELPEEGGRKLTKTEDYKYETAGRWLAASRLIRACVESIEPLRAISASRPSKGNYTRLLAPPILMADYLPFLDTQLD
ncbi:hypothetical protein ACLOJK_026193 [Asimina triloba]